MISMIHVHDSFRILSDFEVEVLHEAVNTFSAHTQSEAYRSAATDMLIWLDDILERRDEEVVTSASSSEGRPEAGA